MRRPTPRRYGERESGPWRGAAGGDEKQNELLGSDLLSQGATPQVPSALVSLTAGFEMGPGVSSPLLSPRSSCFRSSDS